MKTTIDRAALHALDHHWGEAYDIAVTRAGWVAKRLDNGRALVADSADGLHDLIVADHRARPVPHDLLLPIAGQR